MKKTLLILLLLTLSSCFKKAEPHHYFAKIDIVYMNGDKETVNITFPTQNIEHVPRFYLNGKNHTPCVQVYSASYADDAVKSVGCGVRRYEIIELKRIEN